MKFVPTLTLALCMTVGLSLVGCAESGPSADTDDVAAITTASHRVEGSVEGMDCGGCVGSICSAVKEIEGVTDAHADLATGNLVVAIEEGADAEAAKAEIDKAISALSNGKFTVSDLTAVVPAEKIAPADSMDKDAAPADTDAEAPADDAMGAGPAEASVQVASYNVSGMTCTACSSKVAQAVNAIEGVDNAYVCHKSGTCTVTAAEGHEVCPKMVAKTIEAVGFTVSETCDKATCEEGTCTESKADAEQAKAVYTVGGMTCKMCASEVDDAVMAIEGVESAYVCVKNGTCTITAAEGHEVCPKMVAKAIEEAGFTVTETCDKETCEESTCTESKADAEQAKAVYTVGGMSCISCTEQVQTAVAAVEGVESAYVCYAKGTCTITAEDGAKVCPVKVAKAIEEAGYKVTQ